MRLLANKLFPEPYLAADIEAFATARLQELSQPGPSQQPEHPALSNGVSAAAVVALPAPQVAGTHEAGAHASEPAPVAGIKAEPGAAGDAAVGEGRAAQEAAQGSTSASAAEAGEPVAVKAEDDDGAAERRASGAAASTAEPAPDQAPRSAAARAAGAPGGAAAPAGGSAAADVSGGGAGVSVLDSMEASQRRCDLFCALCTKKPALLHELLRVYGQVPCI